MYYISSFLLIPNKSHNWLLYYVTKCSRVLPISTRYASAAFRTLSVLDLIKSTSDVVKLSLAQ